MSDFVGSPENFKFMVANSHSNMVGAFVLKPKEEAKELETQLSLNSILPLKAIDNVYSVRALCTTSFNTFDRAITLKPTNRTKLIEVVEPSTPETPFPLVRLSIMTKFHSKQGQKKPNYINN